MILEMLNIYGANTIDDIKPEYKSFIEKKLKKEYDQILNELRITMKSCNGNIGDNIDGDRRLITYSDLITREQDKLKKIEQFLKKKLTIFAISTLQNVEKNAKK